MLIAIVVALASAMSVPRLAISPIDGLKPSELHDSFNQGRGSERHEAIDIMKPVGTPVRAVVDGVIAKLFLSKKGGNTIYLFDSDSIFCYYYAHLDHYRPALREGMRVSQGEVLGFVGFTGDADPSAPHLHFTIFRLRADKHWWQGTAVDPYPFLLNLIETPSSFSAARR